MRSNKKLKMLLLIVAVLLVGVTVAYAALSATLNVTINKVTQNAQTWNVQFNGTSANATAGGTSATGRTCGAATITPTAVTIANTTLSKPDDSCLYTLTIANTGTVNAKLTSITPTKPSDSGVTCGTLSGGKMVCGNITYTLGTTNSLTSPTLLAANQTLNAGATLTVYLVARYSGTGVSSSAITHTGASFSLVWGQA